ncbi:hypothetical protein [Vibrio cholerae]|uniref:hypothetical protein n=1 Tax=Vibrio cholerae TaxID=666 RepID=UPI001A20265D|nr:hypothetical protein [Vibrio cholerae]HAS8389549.1 hypothetical protein [Vibrio vulnificus]
MKEFLDVLNEAKNVRLNLAIFFVVSILLWAGSFEHIALESLSKTLLQSLFFLTSIRLVYAGISLMFGTFENSRMKKKNAENEKERVLLEEKEKQDKKEKMRRQFHDLDVHQLYIIQELKKQNYVLVRKGAALFTLKNANIIYTPAVVGNSESASLTSLAKSLMDEELWANFDQLKYNALTRFFSGMQPKDVEHFVEFLKKDSICTKRYNPYDGSYYYDNERVFSAFSKTIVFSQPQRSYTYHLDPIAKEVVVSLFGNEVSDNYG